jgi:predicted nucleic acid-binding protein
MTFIDTGPFLARWLPRDEHHRAALAAWEKLSGRALYTSSHVVDETITTLGRKASYAFAADRAESIFASTALEILYANREDELEALRLFRKYADQEVSFTDSISFALMRRYKIQTAFTFDRHFRLAGWKIVP